jgi:hypothetical protein
MPIRIHVHAYIHPYIPYSVNARNSYAKEKNFCILLCEHAYMHAYIHTYIQRKRKALIRKGEEFLHLSV